jgi:hypothetical protein
MFEKLINDFSDFISRDNYHQNLASVEEKQYNQPSYNKAKAELKKSLDEYILSVIPKKNNRGKPPAKDKNIDEIFD